MGNSSSTQNSEANNVDLDLYHDQAAALFRFKILLLGAGESGKSTVMKQLKLIHRVPVDMEEKTRVALGLHINVMDCMKSLISACNTCGVTIPPQFEGTIKKIKAFDDDSNRIDEALGAEVKAMFYCEEIQSVYARRSEFYILDSCIYYMENIDRFSTEGFVPTEEDLVMARVKTTGIVETELEQRIPSNHKYEPNALKFQVIDVGGQRNERRKWINCFDDVKAILFICNLAGYDSVLYEDPSKNRMEESLDVFQKIAQNHVFRDTPIFIFLNKKDLFEAMIRKKDLSTTFPEYTGGNDVMASIGFLQNEFKKRCPTGKEVVFEFVSARVRGDIRNAFGTVKKSLYEDNKQKILDEVTRLYKEVAKVEKKVAGGGGGCVNFNCFSTSAHNV